MAKDSKIEWTHNTFNPWWGCSKVSPACQNCYAEAWAKRVGSNVWGPTSDRRRFGKAHWDEPVKWNSDAESQSTRRRVFCASMADVFESRSDLNEERKRLWDLISKTPRLDWLLLTKRPENIEPMVPWSSDAWPDNVWIGATIENQEWATRRLHHLLKQRAKVRFLSCEPLLGEIDLRSLLPLNAEYSIDWIIAGGESGPRSRPMNPRWARSLRDQSKAIGAAFHFKQWGHWAPQTDGLVGAKRVCDVDGTPMIPLGKKKSGRVLDGLEWNELPSINY